MARVITANTLAEDSSGSVSQFSIRPGRQMQVIRLPQKTLAAQHVYVQVSAEPSNRNPDFSSSGVNEGILKYRPDKFVPFKVPVFDEAASLLQEQAYKKAKKEQPTRTFTEPKPIYWWAYRPELQFSVYELAVEDIRQEFGGQDGPNILENDNPVLTSTDDFLGASTGNDAFVKILYDLQSNTNDALDGYSFDGDKELIFALGEQEVRATVTQGAGGSQILEFDDLSVLSSLNQEDYLSIRLYLNNDTANVLWEWAFGASGLIVNTSDDIGSREAKSFIIGNGQKPISLSIADDLSENDIITWEVVALKGDLSRADLPINNPTESQMEKSYGKIKNKITGRFTPVSDVAGTGTGEYESVWKSGSLTRNNGRHFSFVPDLSSELHTPGTYTPGEQSTASLNGTRYTDVWRHNPHVGYKVTAKINGIVHPGYEVTVKMDEIDVVRQEYKNHATSIPVPERSEFRRVEPVISSTGKVLFSEAELNNTPYSLTPGSPSDLAAALRSSYNSRINDDVQLIEVGTSGLNPQVAIIGPGQHVEFYGPILDTSPCHGSVSDVCDDLQVGSSIVAGPNGIAETAAVNQTTNYGLTVSSPWRNPERNERVSGHINSKHQLGSAIDFVVGTVPGKTRSQLFCILETAGDKIPGYKAVPEKNSSQRDCNATGANGVTHIHTQVK